MQFLPNTPYKSSNQNNYDFLIGFYIFESIMSIDNTDLINKIKEHKLFQPNASPVQVCNYGLIRQAHLFPLVKSYRAKQKTNSAKVLQIIFTQEAAVQVTPRPHSRISFSSSSSSNTSQPPSPSPTPSRPSTELKGSLHLGMCKSCKRIYRRTEVGAVVKVASKVSILESAHFGH